MTRAKKDAPAKEVAPAKEDAPATEETEDAPVKKVDNRGAHLRKPEHLKVPRNTYVPTGKPRGRAPGQISKKKLHGEKMKAAWKKKNEEEAKE